MANTLHGPFVKGASLATGSYGTGVGQSNTFTSGNANNDETQAGVALHSFNPHMIGAGFVLSGATCTKDGVNANQLDIASGEAYLIQSDGTPTLCDIGADNTHTTTGNPSTTMYLDLNPDGSWSWGTSHSAITNHLTIGSVTTDASANIATVVDARPTAVSLLSTMAGLLTLPGLAKITSDNGRISSNGNGQMTIQGATGVYDLLNIKSPNASTEAIIGSGDASYFNGSGFYVFTGGGPDGYVFRNWDGTGGNISGAIKSLGQQATVGSFGVPVIVAQAIAVPVTATTLQTIVTFTPSATGMYRASMYINNRNPTSTAVNANVGWIDPTDSTNPAGVFSIQNSGGVVSPVLLSGTNTVSAGHYATYPLTFYAKAGGAIRVSYQNPAGTPNDVVSAIIERLA